MLHGGITIVKWFSEQTDGGPRRNRACAPAVLWTGRVLLPGGGGSNRDDRYGHGGSRYLGNHRGRSAWPAVRSRGIPHVAIHACTEPVGGFRRRSTRRRPQGCE